MAAVACSTLGSPILIVVSVICRDQCIYYLYYVIIYNKTPAKAFTPPAEKKKEHKVIFRQKSKRVTGLYNT